VLRPTWLRSICCGISEENRSGRSAWESYVGRGQEEAAISPVGAGFGRRWSQRGGASMRNQSGLAARQRRRKREAREGSGGYLRAPSLGGGVRALARRCVGWLGRAPCWGGALAGGGRRP
jgi:hypothetical protein